MTCAVNSGCAAQTAVTNPPFTERKQDGTKAFTVRGELVLRAQDRLVIHGALHDAGLFELSEVFGKDFVRGLGDASAELPEAKFTALELVQDEGLPLASDDAECGRHRTLRQKHKSLLNLS